MSEVPQWADLAFAAAEKMVCPDLLAFDPEAARPFNLSPALICGDSHLFFYRRPELIRCANVFPLYGFCSGGSASGLGNPQSKSQYGSCIARFFERSDQTSLRNFRFFLFKFGQVDLEFVYTYRRIRQRTYLSKISDYLSFADETADRYANFLKSLIDKIQSDAPIVVCSVFPPTLFNSSIVTGYANAHVAFLEGQSEKDALAKELAALEYNSIEERTSVHKRLNENLSDICGALGLAYFDDFSPFVSPKTGLVDDQYIEISHGTDHHIDFLGPSVGAMAPEIFTRLRQTIGY